MKNACAKHGLFRNSPNQDGNFSFPFDDYYGALHATLTTRNRRNRLSTRRYNHHSTRL